MPLMPSSSSRPLHPNDILPEIPPPSEAISCYHLNSLIALSPCPKFLDIPRHFLRGPAALCSLLSSLVPITTAPPGLALTPVRPDSATQCSPGLQFHPFIPTFADNHRSYLLPIMRALFPFSLAAFCYFRFIFEDLLTTYKSLFFLAIFSPSTAVRRYGTPHTYDFPCGSPCTILSNLENSLSPQFRRPSLDFSGPIESYDYSGCTSRSFIHSSLLFGRS
jgi:hypothetical protein